MHNPLVDWHTINNAEAVTELIKMSGNRPLLIFKHSGRCSISNTALNRLETTWKSTETNNPIPYLIDVINERPISNEVASVSGIEHQSPQALIFINGQCVYEASHLGIRYSDMLSIIENKK